MWEVVKGADGAIHVTGSIDGRAVSFRAYHDGDATWLAEVLDDATASSVKLYCQTGTCPDKGGWISRTAADARKTVHLCDSCGNPMTRMTARQKSPAAPVETPIPARTRPYPDRVELELDFAKSSVVEVPPAVPLTMPNPVAGIEPPPTVLAYPPADRLYSNLLGKDLIELYNRVHKLEGELIAKPGGAVIDTLEKSMVVRIEALAKSVLETLGLHAENFSDLLNRVVKIEQESTDTHATVEERLDRLEESGKEDLALLREGLTTLRGKSDSIERLLAKSKTVTDMPDKIESVSTRTSLLTNHVNRSVTNLETVINHVAKQLADSIAFIDNLNKVTNEALEKHERDIADRVTIAEFRDRTIAIENALDSTDVDVARITDGVAKLGKSLDETDAEVAELGEVLLVEGPVETWADRVASLESQVAVLNSILDDDVSTPDLQPDGPTPADMIGPAVITADDSWKCPVDSQECLIPESDK